MLRKSGTPRYDFGLWLNWFGDSVRARRVAVFKFNGFGSRAGFAASHRRKGQWAYPAGRLLKIKIKRNS